MKIFRAFILCSTLLLAVNQLASAENPPVNVTALRKIITGKKSAPSAVSDAMQQLKTAADKHHTEAEYWYAWMRFYGKGNQTADRTEALKYFTLAAEKNHPLALFWVGYFYGNGYVVKSNKDGVEYDPAKAEKLLLLSARAGYKPAMKALANLYMTGQKGFISKPLEAEKWQRQYQQTKDMPEDFFISEPHL